MILWGRHKSNTQEHGLGDNLVVPANGSELSININYKDFSTDLYSITFSNAPYHTNSTYSHISKTTGINGFVWHLEFKKSESIVWQVML